VVLCDLEGRTHEQAARHLGWPIGTVKSRLARGRERLRSRLIRRGIRPDSGLLVAALRSADSTAMVTPALRHATTHTAMQFLAARATLAGPVASLTYEVLKAMMIARWLKLASVVLALGLTASGTALLGRRAARGVEPGPRAGAQDVGKGGGEPLGRTLQVEPGTLRATWHERGNLQASANQDVYCNVEGRSTIIAILPEGSLVTKGQVVGELDSAALRDQLINQTITVTAAEANWHNAKLRREIAEIAAIEYEAGTFKQEKMALSGAANVARSALQKAEARLERTRRARKRLGDIQPPDARKPAAADILADLDLEDRIDSAEQAVLREKVALEVVETKRQTLEKFTRDRTIKDLKVEIERKRADELAKKAAYELEQSRVEHIRRQIGNCRLLAPDSGVIIYAHDVMNISVNQIEEGASVRERQKIFSVPNLATPMLLNIRVDESIVGQIKPGLRARITVDALANETFNGVVKTVAPLPALANKSAPLFATQIQLDRVQPGLRPGMTASAGILLPELENVLTVPKSAVHRFGAKDYVAVKQADGEFEWRAVTLGQRAADIVEIKEGLQRGDVVLRNPSGEKVRSTP
jgi:RND family efflux transporter MFP subunit